MRILLVAALAACGDAYTPTGPTGHSGTPYTFTLPADLEVLPDATYTYDSEWRIAASEVRAATDVLVSWDAKVADAWGVERDPEAFGRLVLVEVAADRVTTMALLADDDLDASTRGTWSAPVAGETTAWLSDLQGFDPPAELVEDPATSWLLLFADEDGARLDLRDAILLTPRADQLGTTLSVPNGAATYTWSARFGNDALRTDEGHPTYTVDWSALTVDAYGKAFDPARVDEVFVGRFDDVAEADDLGGQVLELEAAASAWWTLPSGGTSAVLSDATDGAGATFPGFTADTSWLVGGRCTTCAGPAPTWLAVVDVRAP